MVHPRLLKFLLLAAVILLQSVQFSSAQVVRKVVRVDGGKRTVMDVRIDTALRDSMLRDSLVRDSLVSVLALSDSLEKDSLAIISRGALDDTVRMADSSVQVVYHKHQWKNMPVAGAAAAIETQKFSLTRDTISPTAHFVLSLVPGMGQIYNRQWYKAPIFIGLIGGFTAGGIIASGNYQTAKDDWHRAIDLNLPSDVTDPLERKMKQLGTIRTIFYSAAAVTYLYQIADATFKYRGYMNPIRKATILSAVFPGAGFIYTKTYWRLPIYYGGFAVAATVVDYNNRYYQRYKDAYDAMTDGDPSTVDEFHGRYTEDQLSNARDAYRRDRDLGIIIMAGIYVLNVIDTYVIATLKNWEVDEKLSVNVRPTVFREYAYTKSGGYMSGTGLSLVLRF